MKLKHKYLFVLFSVLFIFLYIQSVGATTLPQSVFNVVDTNGSATVFEANLSADEQDVDIDGTTVHAMIYKDDNNPGTYAGTPDGIPIPQIVVNVGDTVVVHLTNNIDPGCAALACDSSIHWHGIELDNDSDGTGVTQTHLGPSDTYTYRFIVPRPGIFWFHTHMLPGPQTFAGMYGALIVKDANEGTLAGNEIPKADNTHTVVLSDIEFDGDGDVGFLDAGQAIPWATRTEECAMGNGGSCSIVASGATVLVNGQKPDASTHTIKAKSGAGIRLRLINPATNRYFRLKVSNNGADNNLYRIGGEGGFLEKVRLEGGMLGSWDTKYDLGEILVPASGRADVVIVPTGADGTIITISGEGYARSGPSNNEAAGDLLYIEIDDTQVDDAFTIGVDDIILGPDGIVDLKGLPTNTYSDPTIVFDSNSGAGHGSDDPQIRLGGLVTGQLAIDGVQGHFEDSGSDYTLVPYQDATRYAKVDDVLEFTVSNFSGGGSAGQHHPFHHHGFSFQPVRIIQIGDLTDKENTAGDTILYEFDYEEFVDVIDIFSGQRVVVRMRIDDRPKISDNRDDTESMPPPPDVFSPDGGAEGRWVFHCHLFLHATIGMISELVIKPNQPPVADAGPDQTVECASHTGNLLAMDGSGSMDPDGDDLT
ncbi:MAG: multicopper oxidase family protein, partial [Nitrospinota bacterium]|nr:multicopper oxidase family protein [Nitrospinota bacterium]